MEFELLSFLDEYVREGHTVAGACVTDGSQLVLRAGMDFRLRCVGCGHEFMIPRNKIEKNIQRVGVV